MKNYVQYDKTEMLINTASDAVLDHFYISTNKHKPGVIGHRIWLFAGVGKPRRYFLAAFFIAKQYSRALDPDFLYRVRGQEGKRFDPPLEVTNFSWFHELRRAQGNFAFGLNELHERFVPFLEELAKR